jgi:hypothetical protein
MCSKRWAKPVFPLLLVLGAHVIPEVHVHHGSFRSSWRMTRSPFRKPIGLEIPILGTLSALGWFNASPPTLI